MLIMKNSANHYPTKQALQSQATQLLPLLTATLLKLNYKKIIHQRISQQSTDAMVYQGLTRATDDKFGQVMIKWEISADIYYDLTSLGREIKVLKALNSFQLKAQSFINIAPQILANKISIVNISEKAYQLTILVMPYYLQGSLAQYLKQSLTDKQKHQLITQVAYLISNIHQQGWLHNDIKPSNFLIGTEPANKSDTVDLTYDLLLTDFALAQRTDSAKNNSNANVNAAGTPAYLAPERWQGQTATEQSDIYAFGITIYEILTGKRPLKVEKQSSDLLQQWATQHCQQPIPKLPSEYQDYQMIMNKALTKRIENRYKNMSDVIADLDKLPNDKSL